MRIAPNLLYGAPASRQRDSVREDDSGAWPHGPLQLSGHSSVLPFFHPPAAAELIREITQQPPKESNLVAVTKIPKRIGQRQQVIVMNPDQVLGLQYFVQLSGKTLVDAYSR